MDTSISPRIADFRAPPPYPNLAAPEEKPAQGMSPEKLDQLDAIATRMIERLESVLADARSGSYPTMEYLHLPRRERIYVALAADLYPQLYLLSVTIPEAIDELGWVDASAMVARWRNRRA